MDIGLNTIRITDYAIALDLLDSCWNDITEDNGQQFIPDIINEHWIAFIIDNVIIGGYRIHQTYDYCYQVHAVIKPGYRKENSFNSCMAMYRYVLEHTECKKLFCEIPEFCENVIKFVEKVGFVFEGRNRLCYMKNKKLYDVLSYGITKDEIEGMLWQQEPLYLDLQS